MTYQELFCQSPKYNRLLRLSVPLVLASLGLVFMQFTDAIFLSWYSPTAIAAAGIAGMLNWLLVSPIVGTVSYTGTITANNLGADLDNKTGSMIWQGVYLALIGGLITFLLSFASDFFFSLTGHSPDLQVFETQYLRILLAGSVLNFIACAISGFFIGRGDNTRLMVAQLSGQVANVVLDYVMIFGKFGFPEMGVAGAALATVLSNLFTIAFLTYWFFKRDNRKRFITCDWHPNMLPIRQLLRFGLPNGLQWAVSAFLWSLFFAAVGRIGTVELAATSIAFRLNGLASVPVAAVSRALGTLVGKSHGELNHKDAVAYMGHGTVVCQVWMTLIAVTYVVLPEYYFELFKSDSNSGAFTELMACGVTLLRFVALYCLADSINIAMCAGLQAVGATKWIFKGVSIVTFLVIIGIMFADYYKCGLMVIWSLITFFIMALPPLWFFRIRSGAWKSIRVATES